ncbi:MAG: hypothetical protein ABIM19_07280, partial [candidate division WOR-3 bacterium]
MTGLFMTAGALMGQGLFARTYGGDSSDGISYLIQTQDGGYAVAGWTKSFGAGDYDFLVVKLASDGSLDWARTFGGDTTDYAISVVQTSDGGFAVGGRTWSYGAGYNDFLVLKLDNAGSLQWAKTFGGTASLDYADCMIQTTDGGFAITGESSNFVTWSCLILKLDNAGNMQWARTSDIFGDQVCSMVQASDGGYAILGHTPGSQEMLVLKIDQAGSFSWARVLDGTRSQTSTGCIIQTSDGGYAAAKSTNNFGAGSEDCLVVKLDPSGNLSWARTIGGPSWDNACSFIQTSDGGYAMVGVTRSFGAGGYDLFLVKLDSAGNLSWARTFGGTGYDQGYSLIQTPD